ncbi:MAG TPA: 4-(cytidine 5'-diphospho)-2-C-methyl-D-erythritol kinase [Pirellulales bacterium]|jgi:4-diphosphocytidyl-2-C-methyl-D-erythritol kinase|nr:4-(cytidine 5'-diphospho)-2-C-methyl-D-erythritol kinase [Pirellulales bacterium]
MSICRPASAVRIFAPAKLNLFFEILARRADGYHEIETLMLPLNLGDVLEFRATAAGPLRLQCEWAYQAAHCQDAPFEPLPSDGRNLVVRALELLRVRAGVECGAELRLLKRVPAAAGLGGGSSDAAAALIVANQAWNLGWPLVRLAEVAAAVGSDVPFFLVRGPALCRGRGEAVEPLGRIGALTAVIVKPPDGLSTPAVYQACRPAVEPRLVTPLVSALRRGAWARCGRLLHNQLESAAAQLSPWPARLRSEFDRTDCLGHQLSGSGTSYFGLCRNPAQARTIAARLRARRLGQVFIAQSL